MHNVRQEDLTAFQYQNRPADIATKRFVTNRNFVCPQLSFDDALMKGAMLFLFVVFLGGGGGGGGGAQLLIREGITLVFHQQHNELKVAQQSAETERLSN